MRLSSRLSVVAAVAIAGSDGALWFTGASNLIGRITTAGKVTSYAAHLAEPEEIAAGADGALWFTSQGGNSIGRITTSATTGKTTFISAPGAAGIPVKVETRMATEHVIMVTKHVTTATKHVSS